MLDFSGLDIPPLKEVLVIYLLLHVEFHFPRYFSYNYRTLLKLVVTYSI